MTHPVGPRIQAPELRGDFWFNAEPVTIRDFAGSVILLAFWDYSSAASLEIIPLLRQWHDQYASLGLAIVGIHSPEFGFAKDPAEVESAVTALQIRFPVAIDNTHSMMHAYQVQELPTLVLVDRHGDIYYVQCGRSRCDHTERALQVLLREAGNHGELPVLLGQSFDEELPGFLRPSPAMPTGYLHGALGNIEGYSPELPAPYMDLGYQLEGKFYLDGKWLARPDSVEFCGDGPGHIVLLYSGRNVQTVMSSRKPGAVIEVRSDGAPVPAVDFGSDLRLEADGTTTVAIDRPKLFKLLAHREMEEHQVTFIPRSPGISFYSISFERQAAPGTDLQTPSKIFTN
ncbi:MAG: redoxin domain-containing protein [Ignavibacteriales bacterium]|nr:redoxin domain-containing protein [Ignavibacteriales bacterium]